mgnify:CR=1 FL=1
MPGLLEKDQVGKREDLADFIAIVDSKKTPFTSMVSKSGKAANTLFEWQVDDYQKPRITGVVDGSDVTDFENAAKNRAKLQNYIQVQRRTAKVSRLAEEVSTVAGVAGEMANAVAKKMVELKRDMEAACLGGNEMQADDGSVPYLTRGLDKWIQTTAQALNPVPAAFRPATAQVVTTATASLTEDGSIQDLLAALFDATGMSGRYYLIAGSVLRRRFTDMTRTVANATSTATKVRSFGGDIADTKITNTTTVYEGDYGTIEILSSSFVGVDSAGDPNKNLGYLLDMDKIALRFNKRPSVEKLPDNGGGPRALLECVSGLEVWNPIGLGKFKP